MGLTGDQVHGHAAACIKVGHIGSAVSVDGHQHPLVIGAALENQLFGPAPTTATFLPVRVGGGTAWMAPFS